MYLCMRYSQYINKEFVNCQLGNSQFSIVNQRSLFESVSSRVKVIIN